MADEEGVTVSEYNKWLMLEQNWESAEDTRQNYMEGSQLRKTRDERHRERGMERQAASIEQMKQAKTKVEEHREQNLEHGKVRLIPSTRTFHSVSGVFSTDTHSAGAFRWCESMCTPGKMPCIPSSTNGWSMASV